MIKPCLRFFIVLLIASQASLAGASEKAWFGVGFRTEFGGFIWKPTLESVSLAVVAPGSPAASQHLAVGDAVLEIQGIPVSGAKGEQLDKLKAILDKPKVVGDVWQLKLSRGGGVARTVVLTAVPRPE